jgi:hypothetical protein
VLLQVGFFDEKLRRYTKVARKSNDILNRLEKTRRELQPDFKTEKEVSRWYGLRKLHIAELLTQSSWLQQLFLTELPRPPVHSCYFCCICCCCAMASCHSILKPEQEFT